MAGYARTGGSPMKRSFIFSQTAFIVLFLFAAHLKAQWVQVSGSYGGVTRSVAVSGANLLAGTVAGVFLSTNSGTSWTFANAGLTDQVTAFALRPSQTGGNDLFAGTDSGGVFLSINNGSSWTAVNNGLANSYIYSLATNNSSIFAGTGQGVFRSTDNGASWSNVTSGIIDVGIQCLAAKDSLLFASTSGGVFRSTDNGENWTRVDSGLVIPRPPRRSILFSIAITDSAIFGGSSGRVYQSTDKGLSWHTTGQFPPIATSSPNVHSLVEIGSNVFAGDGFTVYRSSDNGTSWIRVGSGLPRNAFLSQTIYALDAQGSTLIASTAAGVFYSTDLGVNWTGLNNGLNASSINTLTVSGPNLFSDAGNGYYIQRSTDNGTSWAVVNDTVYYHFRHLVSNGSYVVTATNGPIIANNSSPLLRSSDLGESWTSLGNQPIPEALAINDEYIFTGYLFGSVGVRRCANDSSTWIPVNNGLPDFPTVTTLHRNGSNIFSGTFPNGIFYSPDNGTNWNPLNVGWGENLAVSAIAVSGATIFAGTAQVSGLPTSIIGRGVFRSTDFGASWAPANNGLTDTSITALVIHDSALLAGTNSGIFLSTDNGTSWKPFNSGLPYLNVATLGLNETYVYAGIFGGVWRRPLSEIISSVQTSHENVVRQFRLEQNYPNPFNPITTIKYSLAKPSHVTLKIFNLIGEELATLVNDQQIAGGHEIIWNAENFSSGVYYCQLKTDNDFTQTRKLVLLK